MSMKSLFLVPLFASAVLSKIVKYDWKVEWIQTDSADGFSRPVIGINGQWPCPTIDVDIGDRLIVNVHNALGNQSTAIHWHGLFQEGSNYMDGAGQVTQCPIAPGQSFEYDFKVNQPGTYWYHSHAGGQYADGLRGPLIVHDKHEPSIGQYDEEIVVDVTDWYHSQVPSLLDEVFSPSNVAMRPPLPDSGLVNGKGGPNSITKFKFVAGKTYKFRVINMSALTNAILYFDEHIMTIVEIDGVYTQPTVAGQIYVSAGQRYAFIVKAKETAEKNYAFQVVFDINPSLSLPVGGYRLNNTGYLVYNDGGELPAPPVIQKFDVLDDLTILPRDNMLTLGPVDQVHVMNFTMTPDANKIPRAYYNNVSYIHQDVPTLYTAMTVGDDAEDPRVYGQVNPIIIKKGQVIEMVINNFAAGHHPFHLHGHEFQVIARGSFNEGVCTPEKVGAKTLATAPMRRDTVNVDALSWVVVRFKADRAGVWLMHCHIEWHVNMGMTVTFIESPLELQKTLKIPQKHIELCKAQCIKTEGNAAGDTTDHFNLQGARVVPDSPDHGANFLGTACDANGHGEHAGTGSTVSEELKCDSDCNCTKYIVETFYSTSTSTSTVCEPTAAATAWRI